MELVKFDKKVRVESRDVSEVKEGRKKVNEYMKRTLEYKRQK